MRKLMKKLRKNDKSRKGTGGFSLAELMIATAILVTAVSGILISYLRCIELNEISRNSSLAVQAARSQMEIIKATNFNNIMANFNNTTFNIAGLNGMGVSYVDNTNPELLQVVVSVSWQQKNGRVFGEDTDIDGAIDAGEDTNVNGILDSPVLLVSNVFER